jgi:hypothetical protein
MIAGAVLLLGRADILREGEGLPDVFDILL